MIEAEALTRDFGPIRAVDQLDFSVVPGEVLGVLGPNGAGKSTTMKLITGYLAPTEGRTRIFGHDVMLSPSAARGMLGYLPEGAPLYGEMTPVGLLGFIARMRGLEASERTRRIGEVVEQLSLREVQRQPLGTLSKGYRRRVALAQAILHAPRALILDEPTDGLDPNQKHDVRSLIRDLSVDRIVIISTHILEEVEALCTRVVVMHRGRKLADESPESLARRSRYHGAVNLRCAKPVQGSRLEQLRGVRAAEPSDHEGCAWTLLAEDPSTLVASLRDGGLAPELEITELFIERGRLDEVFRRLTADDGE